MKLFREVIIIFGIYYLGEGIKIATGIPIPGNLIGMMLLLLLLCTHIVRLEHISTLSDFLLSHMSFFFIPAGVGLLTSLVLIKDIWFQIIILCLVTTFITMGISGYSVQFLIRRKKVRK